MTRALALLLVLVALVGGFVHIENGRRHAAEERASAAEDARREAEDARDLALAHERVVVRYVDRVQVVRANAQIITKEIPIYVTPTADAACTVPVGFVRLHDAAAANQPTTPSTGNPDAPAAGVALSDVAGAVADNYATCHANAEQVIGLQDYVRELLRLRNP
ncbi:hypothetical protein [Lysobacter gummosus]|uniref:Lipoprotein n=1 Tax=Lysobacter gummosus TaxID=262324 RepID=A0ABY3X9C8_9GAMM|nr:hypothetical protein [Lysobacter gummosus]ALN92514.1 putative lipoprotein [Lysobacter gummosus]UNP28089.1 hypothetical protein MOV92_16495 [Lysobacter gummosus]